MMHKTLYFLFTIPLLFSAINSNNDYQFWYTEGLMGKVRDDFAFHSEFELRFGDDVTKLYLFYGEVGFHYTPREWLEWGLMYRQFGVRQGESDNWSTIYAPMTHLTFTWKKNDWELSDRNRYMFMMTDPKFHPNRSMYRNMVKLVFPGSASKMFYPFISEEIFILQGFGFNQSRTIAGCMIKIPPHANLSLYYMLRYLDQHKIGWTHQNVFGLKAKIQF